MAESTNLISAQIKFLGSRLALVHISNEYYPFVIQPLFRILFGEDHNEEVSNILWTDRHEFLNFSITPFGCSMICSKYLVDLYLAPLVKQFNSLIQTSTQGSTVEISNDEHIVVQVECQGFDAGQRVLELTGPLAMAGISIFFITTYFCDYILVPLRARQTVVTTLQQRGFVLAWEAEAYISKLSPTLNHQEALHSRSSSASSGPGSRPASASVPTTPPARDIPELQVRTFAKLQRHGIKPTVNADLRLTSCAAPRDLDVKSASKLKDDLIQVLVATNAPSSTVSSTTDPNSMALQSMSILDGNKDQPRRQSDFSAAFLSVTLSTEPVSILLEQRLLPKLGSTLLSSHRTEDILVPITLDLRKLGWNATGIVGGVAGRLAHGPVWNVKERGYDKGGDGEPGEDREDSFEVEAEPLEISFLSSAKAGSIIVRADQLEAALRTLEAGMEEVTSQRK